MSILEEKSLKKVSIIVPLYKSEPHICTLLDNLLGQTYENLELLLINDGSPDQTKKVVSEEMLKRNDARILYFEKENGGIADTKNFGLNHTSGDYVMFCDHDDWMEQNAVEKMVNALEQTGSEIAVSKYVRDFKYKKSFLEKIFPFHVTLDFFSETGSSLKDSKGMLVEVYQALWGKLYKKSLFDGFHFNVELNGMDDLGSTSILLGKASKIVGLKEVLYHYAYYKNSTIQSATSGFENKKIYDAYQDVETWYSQNNLVSLYEEELEYLYYYHCVLSYGVRTLQRSKHPVEDLKNIKIDLLKKYPNYKKNKYYKKMNIAMKSFVWICNKPVLIKILQKFF